MSRYRLRLGGSADTSYGIDKNQILGTHSIAIDYLIEDRNPLLIIYFVRPSLPMDADEEDFTSDRDRPSDLSGMLNLHAELQTRKYPLVSCNAL